MYFCDMLMDCVLIVVIVVLFCNFCYIGYMF